jgi:hypothetical protein
VGILKYLYSCKNCGEIHASYFNDMVECQVCGCKELNREDITEKQIDRFDGKQHYWKENK